MEHNKLSIKANDYQLAESNICEQYLACTLHSSVRICIYIFIYLYLHLYLYLYI